MEVQLLRLDGVCVCVCVCVWLPDRNINEVMTLNTMHEVLSQVRTYGSCVARLLW